MMKIGGGMTNDRRNGRRNGHDKYANVCQDFSDG